MLPLTTQPTANVGIIDSVVNTVSGRPSSINYPAGGKGSSAGVSDTARGAPTSGGDDTPAHPATAEPAAKVKRVEAARPAPAANPTKPTGDPLINN